MDATELVELARELAAIASTTTDPETGRQLMDVVARLLSDAGLPQLDDDSGGNRPPGRYMTCPA